AKARFIGTCAGVTIALFVIRFSQHDPVLQIIVMFLSAIGFTFIASAEGRYRDAGALGMVTLVIILYAKSDPTYEYAFARFLEINLGIAIALVVNKLLFPIHAYKRLIPVSANTLKLFAEYYRDVYTGQAKKSMESDSDYEQQSLENLQKQKQLAKEAASESLFKNFSQNKYKELLQSERRIFRLLTLLEYFIHEDVSEKSFFFSDEMQGVHGIIDKALVMLGNMIQSNAKNDFSDLSQNLLEAREILKKLSQSDELMSHVSHTVIFILEQILKQMEDIESLLIME
ncbi:MAG: FUSC family protein, partial [Proteobacteria bacterium]|nr:FUSC family protein [Pseudomonadota bacterium]